MNDDSEPRGSLARIIVVVVVLATTVLLLLLARNCGRDAIEPGSKTAAERAGGEDFRPTDGPGTPATDESAEDIFAALGVGESHSNPRDLVRDIGRRLESGKLGEAARLIGRGALSPEQIEDLRKLARDARLKLDPEHPVTEIGELEINRRGRWALNLAGEQPEQIVFDLLKQADGKWAVQRMVLPGHPPGAGPPGSGPLADALGITHRFLQATLSQRFDDAKGFVDSEAVSDAKIAGLCIIFEEGKYKLRTRQPVRAMFNRGTTAGFLANVQAVDGAKAAQLGLTVQRDDESQPWLVTEVNLDTLLADYANRVAGGDVHYTPLVRNPEGGDTLILYFNFDEAGITPRTARQLEIVTLLLQTDPDKKLSISGHTDALGSEEYNRELSGERAAAVKEFLVESGVDPAQIETVAFGKTQPRRPNVTANGQDDPSGRRANRRTEIYLDF